MNLRDYYEWLALPPEDFLRQCERTPFQASGPGGQKRNRVYSAIRLTHTPTGLRAESASFREAARKLTDAVDKLRLALAIQGAQAEGQESDDAGTPVALERIKPPANFPAFRVKINPDHKDFPATVLHALAAFHVTNADLKITAGYLSVSPSAFARYLKLDKQVLAAANRLRVAAGHPVLN